MPAGNPQGYASSNIFAESDAAEVFPGVSAADAPMAAQMQEMLRRLIGADNQLGPANPPLDVPSVMLQDPASLQEAVASGRVPREVDVIGSLTAPPATVIEPMLGALPREARQEYIENFIKGGGEVNPDRDVPIMEKLLGAEETARLMQHATIGDPFRHPEPEIPAEEREHIHRNMSRVRHRAFGPEGIGPDMAVLEELLLGGQ